MDVISSEIISVCIFVTCTVSEILNRWIQEIQTFAQSNIDFLLRLKMMDIATHLNLEYCSRPLELVRKTKHILETEIRGKFCVHEVF